PGLGPAQDLLAAAFMVEPGHTLPRVFEVGDRIALLQVLDRKPASPEQVEAQLDARTQQLLAEKRDARTSAWLDRRRSELIESGELHVALENLGRPARAPMPASRRGGL